MTDVDRMTRGVRELLLGLGEDVDRDGLRRTPERVARALVEMTRGAREDPKTILATDFEGAGYDEMVTVRGVDFSSLCEHHLMTFSGTATVAYIPRSRVVGLSKLPRLVDCFARRLQVQERMTVQIAEALREHLQPVGWGVQLRARHLCLCARGAQKAGAEMVTTALGGALRSDPQARQEFLRGV